VRRAGPFAADPRDDTTWRRSAGVVARLQGARDQEFVDADVLPGRWYAYLIELEDGGAVSIAGEITVLAAAPALLRLHAAVPNPFNPSTRLVFDVPAGRSGVTAARDASHSVPARLDVLDARGRLVVTLHQGALAPGRHAAFWDGRDARGGAAPSGVYMARLQSGGAVATGKLTLLR
jgi:hypothetical protein